MKDIKKLEIHLSTIESMINDCLRSKVGVNADALGLALEAVNRALNEIRNLLVEMDCEKSEIKKNLDILLKILRIKGIVDHGK